MDAHDQGSFHDEVAALHEATRLAYTEIAAEYDLPTWSQLTEDEKFNLGLLTNKVISTMVHLVRQARDERDRARYLAARLEADATEPSWFVNVVDEYGMVIGESNVVTHHRDACQGRGCVRHHPSDHHMRGWPITYRADQGISERRCEHGIGHPDPDDIAYLTSRGEGIAAAVAAALHGCDGCCQEPQDGRMAKLKVRDFPAAATTSNN